MSNYWSDHGETPEDKERRLALCACTSADVIYRGVRDRLCYFEVYFADGPDGPKAVLSLPTDGLTAEKIAKRIAEEDQKRRGGKVKSGDNHPVPDRRS